MAIEKNAKPKAKGINATPKIARPTAPLLILLDIFLPPNIAIAPGINTNEATIPIKTAGAIIINIVESANKPIPIAKDFNASPTLSKVFAPLPIL